MFLMPVCFVYTADLQREEIVSHASLRKLSNTNLFFGRDIVWNINVNCIDCKFKTNGVSIWLHC